MAVAFYEHLFDDWSLREQIVPWLSPHVSQDAWPLWQARLDEPKRAELRRLLDEPAAPRWRDHAASTPINEMSTPRSRRPSDSRVHRLVAWMTTG